MKYNGAMLTRDTKREHGMTDSLAMRNIPSFNRVAGSNEVKLSNWTIEEQRAVLRFLLAKSVKPAEIHDAVWGMYQLSTKGVWAGRKF